MHRFAANAFFATHATAIHGEMRLMNPDEQPDDDPRRPPRAPFVPPESWIEAFDAQCTAPMLKGLRRYVAWWARIIGFDAGNDYAEDLVQNALTDTYQGVLRWDPHDGELEAHLLMVIRLRSRRDRKRARRYELVSFDYLDPDRAMSTQVEASLAHDQAPQTRGGAEYAAAAMDRTMAELRALTLGDPRAQRFLGAIEQDVSTKADIMRLAGLTSLEYRNTRRRISRLVDQLTSGRAISTKED
jgi:hypothetical protein